MDRPPLQHRLFVVSGLLAELCGRVDADLSESMRNEILSAPGRGGPRSATNIRTA